ncbi:hypothetical protein BGZ96_010843 [Linnemannia gamsii]|uniref:Uncharacterized protein n=1 Tax=Linnemannia gamsii TaxID=64522 RepID=A0ABQ7JV83_9FUNG|nr:hypothetical protein BGZ96_010843 [Linnemannia gamsii]
MPSPSEQQIPQQWNQPSGTAFAEGLPLWTAGTINSRSLRNPFVKSFGLRHKATMDWGMRARARTQRHWDKYWHQLETGDESSDLYMVGTTSSDPGTDTDMDTGGPIILWLPGESPLHSLFLRRGLAYELANATAGLLVALEHRFYGNSIPRFQDSLVVHKDGSSIFDVGREKQELSSSHPDLLSNQEFPLRLVTTPPPPMKGEEEEYQRAGDIRKVAGSQAPTSPNLGPTKVNHQISIDKASRARIKGHRHKNLGDDRQQDPHPPHDQTDKVNGNRTSNGNNDSDSTDDGVKEGLPLDLLKYLNVDQSIEDIAHFIELFPTLQPKLFLPGECDRATTTPNLRWILAGCSYGGNLAAWTRQRYPTKVFAAFASSAPIRSALDFFEYSTSQTDILGDKCSTQLGLARDFLDGALQMTDGFMQQMDAFDLEIKQQSASSPTESTSTPLTGQDHAQLSAETGTFYDISASAATATNPVSGVGDEDKARRQAAKLRVLSWFSPDFAREYAAEGEEVHAAGWIWWTVASAVQYNAVVSPITVQPAKTAVDILCDAMDLAKVDDLAGSGSSSNNNSWRSQLKSLRYTETLASWFKDQQYFTPTKQEDLQPSDLDPTSVQNLAGMAWLWQTCSELGCYADEAQRSESVFSRLLTLEAAWQECQFYFSTTHPPAHNSITRPSCFSSPPSYSEDTPVAESHVVKQAGAVEEVDTTASTHYQDGQSSGEAAGDAQQFVASNPGPIQQQQEKREDILLMGYPDVETNVNTKFHGWEIAQDPCYPSESVTYESAFETGGDDNDSSNNNNPGSDESHSASSPTSIKATTAAGTTTKSLRDLAATAASAASESEPSQDGIVEQEAAEDSSVTAQSRFPRTASELDDWLIDHPGGRYYFTNGEKDPWKELTLASSRALEFLSRPRVGSRSGGIDDSKDVETGDKERSRKRVASRQHSTVPAVPLESAESLESALPASIKTGQGGREGSTVALVPQDAIDDKQDDDPVVTSKESSFSPASPINVTTTSTQHRNIGTTSPHPKLSDQDEDVTGDSGSFGSDGTIRVLDEVEVEVDEIAKEDEGGGTPEDNNQISEDEYGDRTVMRIISDASHCQDILYESSDLNSVQLRAEREHVLKTFVRWIEIDNRRRQRALERRQR